MQEILSHQEIMRKITRLAHEIIENVHQYIPNIVIAGIHGNGMLLAEKLHAIVQEELKESLPLLEVELDKENPLSKEIIITPKISLSSKHNVILVDDVINSGKTMQYALLKLLESPVNSVKTVALVNRTHRRYPIQSDFVGLSLSTTLQNRVEVHLKDNFTASLV